MATTYTIKSVTGSTTNQCFWQLTSSLGNIKMFPIGSVNLEVHVSGTSDYSFIWSRNEVDQFEVNINSITLIHGSAPAGNNVATDLASILALI